MFKDKLKKFMEEGNLSQTYISGVTGKSKGTVSYWLSGKRVPSEESLEEIAVALGLPTDYFLEEPQTGFRRLGVAETARILHTCEDTIRLGLQQKVFPWGYAIQKDGRWIYIINAGKLADMEGVTI